MTLEEYRALKSINTEAVLEKMRNELSWALDDAEAPVPNQLIIPACFVLWSAKQEEYHNSDDYRARNGLDFCGEMLIEDVLGLFEEEYRWQRFVSLQTNFTDDELKAAVLFSHYWDSDDPAPEGLLNLVDKCLETHVGDNVVEYCANIFEYSLYKGVLDKEVTISAYEDCYPARTIGMMRQRMLDLDNVTILVQIDEAIVSDRVFVNFGEWCTVEYIAETEMGSNKRRKWKGIPQQPSYTRDRLIAAISSLSDSGRAVLLMRAGQLSGKEYELLRQFIVDSGYVSGVIALTDKIYEGTWVNTYILILEKRCRSVRFCDARTKFEKVRKENGKQINQLTENDVREIYNDYLFGDGFSRTVSLEEVKENDYVLLPQRYVCTNAYRETCRLGDCVREISRGISLNSKETDTFVGKGSMKCITPMSLSSGVVAKPNYFDKDNFDKKINYAERLNLLINKSGKPIRTAVADDTYVVVGNTYILRMNYGGVSPYYIKCYLESPQGQAELMKYVVGENTPMITVANLQKIEIPLFEKEKQREFERRAEDYTRELQGALYKMDELQEIFE